MKEDWKVVPFIMQHQELSPDVIRAQRQAELKQIAAYRAHRMAAYAAWSNPEAIALRKAEHEAAAAKALEAGKAMALQAREQIASKKEDELMKHEWKLSPIMRTRAAKIGWWQRLVEWWRS